MVTAQAPATLPDVARHALAYAARGWRVFPLQPGGKKPLPGSRGFLDAVSDPAEVVRLFADPSLNLGVATGGGLLVLDVDRKGSADGAESLARLLEQHGALPRAPAVATPSGGWHLYLYAAGEHRSTAGRLGPGLDSRARGGYVVAPPSTVDGRKYRWCAGRSPRDVPLAPAPAWLLEALKPAAPQPAEPYRPPLTVSTSPRYVAAAIEDECLTVAHAPEGTRNHALNAAAFALARFVAAGEADAAAVREALLIAARHAGLPDYEAQRTIRSAFEARVVA